MVGFKLKHSLPPKSTDTRVAGQMQQSQKPKAQSLEASYSSAQAALRCLFIGSSTLLVQRIPTDDSIGQGWYFEVAMS